MKTKNKMLTVGLAFLTLLSACQKEPINRLTLTSEGMGGGEKMTVSGLSSYWQTGDVVNINGEESSVTVNGSQAYVDGEFSADNYCIVFPSSIYQSRSGSTVTVNMPASYQYKTSGGRQVLDAPMAYYGTADNGNVMMKHLTGALNVQITGPSGISIDRITIGTSQHRVMSGEMQFNLSDIENIGSSTTDVTGEHRTVQMFFDNESFSTGTVQIPIPVMNGNVNFTVKVEGHVEGTKHTFERTQNTGGHLGRAELGIVTVDINEGQPNVTTSALFPTTIIGGTAYYEISTPQNFRLMSDAVYRDLCYGELNYKNAKYSITDDLDMNGIRIKSIWHFSGIIDGGSHSISNLVVTESSHSDGDVCYDQIGLFTTPNGATISNIIVNGLTLELLSSGDPYGGYVGAIAGDSYGIKISNVHISNFKLNISYSKRLVLGGFIGQTSSNRDTIVNSSVFFANNQDVTSGGSSRGNSNYSTIGGIVGRGSCVSLNTNVNLSNLSFRIVEDDEYARRAKCLVGGVFGTSQRVLTSDVSLYNNVAITGNITASGNSNVYSGKIYNYYTSGIYYSSTNSFDGVDVSGLTINGE